MRSISLRGLFTALPALAVVFGTGCPPEDEPARRASLNVAADDATLDTGASTTVNVTSKGADGKGNTDAVTVVLSKPDSDPVLAGAVGPAADALSAGPLTLTPDADGKANFVAACSGVGTLILTLTTDAVDKEKVLEVRCSAPDDFIFVLDDDLDADCGQLQGDGVSSCRVDIEITRQFADLTIEPAAGASVRVEVTAVTGAEILDGVRGLDPDGDPNVLALDDLISEPTQVLAQVTGDANGVATFFVRSPVFGLAETVVVRVSLGDTVKNLTFIMDSFENKSELSFTADRSELESLATTNLNLAAKDTDGTAASGRTIALTNNGGALFTAAAGVVTIANGGADAFVTLDNDGNAVVEVTAPTVVGRNVPLELTATFDTGVNAEVVPPLVIPLELSISEQGSVIANADFEEQNLQADANPAEVVGLTIAAEQGGTPFNNVTATATIGADSLALIRFSGAVGGASPVSRTVASLTGGTVTFDVVAASVLSRGTARVEIEVFDGAEKIFDEVRSVNVDRNPILQSLTFKDAVPATIGVRGGTLPSSTVVSFQLFDDTGAPLAGVPVSFVANATADRGVSVEASDISSGDGTVSTTLLAGTIAGPVTVVVTARPANGGQLTVSSSSIAIVGGLPTFLNSNFVCDVQSGALLGTACTAQLVDRFTNRAGADIQVQFRAEGGNIDPSVTTDGDGAATAAFLTGNPGHPGADVASWSYGRRRSNAADIAAFNTFGGAGACTDGTVTTPCDLIALCDSGGASEDFCPLPGRQSNPDLVPVQRNGAAFDFTQSRRCDDPAELALDPRACGFPIGCLDGTGIDCAVNPGCFDFSGATSCPENGLLTLIASVRGEESFLDGNGNGILDFVDLSGDGRHQGGSEPIGIPCNDQPGRDPNCVANADVAAVFCLGLALTDPECQNGVRAVDDFIDTPEPFLDKNGSCSRDNFLTANANGMGQIERQITSDLFSDVDGSQTYGFDPDRDNLVDQVNGTWDADTEIFMETQLLEVAGVDFVFGEACTPGVPHTCNQTASAAAANTVCTEVAPGVGIAEDCSPQGNLLVKGDFGSYLYMWRDGNGNCPTTDFSAETSIDAQGLVTAAGTERKLDAGACGFVSATDVDRPWCKVHPRLGAPVLDVFIAVDCDTDIGDDDSKITFQLTDTELQAQNEIGVVVDADTCN